MNNGKLSEFMLERYRLGELFPEDKKALEEILAADGDLRSRLAALDESDRELRLRYSQADFLPRNVDSQRFKILRLPNLAKIAAVFLVCLLLPLVYYLRLPNEPTDRAKGTVLADPKSRLADAELSVYLKDESGFQFSDTETPLADSRSTPAYQAVLHEGNTVQLAYTAPAGDYYGVIFSIDGRAEVTMHYPYRRGQSSRLVSGRKTFLDEAYTLDDAPAYEVFVMVISGKPLDVEAVLSEAQKIAVTVDLLSVDLKSTDVFEGCEVETITVLKN